MIPSETPIAQHYEDNRQQSTGRRLSDADRVIGAYLRAARRERRISQFAIADSLGLTFPQIQKYETGANRITVSTFIRLARAIGIAPTVLLAAVCADIDGMHDACTRRTVSDHTDEGLQLPPPQNGISSKSSPTLGRGSAT